MKIISFKSFDEKMESLTLEERGLILDYLKLAKTKENQRLFIEENSSPIKDNIRVIKIGPLRLLFSFIKDDKNRNILFLLDIVTSHDLNK